MDELGKMAFDMFKTIKREDKFYEAKKNGGFIKRFQAKEFNEVK